MSTDKMISRRQALALSAGAVAAARTGVAKAAAGAFPTSWTFGDVTVTKVMDMEGPFSAERAFPGAPMSEFDLYADMLVPHFYDSATKNILFSYHTYLVRTPKYVIIVDAGQGNDKKRGNPAVNMRKGPYLENLKAAGVTPDQVNFVMNTHFHSDHIGWDTRLEGDKYVPTFPKARYLFNRFEVEGQQKNISAPAIGASWADSIQPVLDSGQVDLINGDHEIGDGLRIVFAPGHTPGHHCLAINSKGRRAILSGDILHNPIEVVHPDWTVLFDDDKEAGRTQRLKFVDGHTDVDVTIFAAHFGGPTAGKIISEKGGKRRFKTLVS